MGYYELESCPHCRKLLDIRRGAASKSPIGPPVISCPYCSLPVKTGQQEWQTMTDKQKMLFYLRVFWWCIGAFLLVGCGSSIFITVLIYSYKLISPSTLSPIELLLLSSLSIGGIAFALTIKSAKTKIYDSQKRTKEESLQRVSTG